MDPAIDPRDLDDAIADIVLLLIPAVLEKDWRRVAAATLSVAASLGIEGDGVDRLRYLEEALS